MSGNPDPVNQPASPAPATAIQAGIPAADGRSSKTWSSAAFSGLAILDPLDHELIDRALLLGDRLINAVQEYQSGLVLYNNTGNPQAMAIRDKAKVKLVNLLAYPFGFF